MSTNFEAMYQQHGDPWQVHSAWYERRKRHVLLASLPQECYRLALELGCGTGATSAALARRCERVMAVDVSNTAIQQCRQFLRYQRCKNVHTAVVHLPAEWPLIASARADLIVVSELAYYLAQPDLEQFLQRCVQSLAKQGDWVMCHYLPDFHDRLQATHTLHQSVSQLPQLDVVVQHQDEAFLLTVWRKR